MAIREQINKSKEFLKKKDSFNILNYFDLDLIVFLEKNTRNSAIQVLIDKLDEKKKICDKKTFLKAIMNREKIVSTAIGMGVAVPHAKLPCLKDFFVAVGIQRKRGLKWESLDGSSVRLVFMIGGPEDHQDQYLRILSNLTQIIKDEDIRKSLIAAESKEDVLKILKHGQKSFLS